MRAHAPVPAGGEPPRIHAASARRRHPSSPVGRAGRAALALAAACAGACQPRPGPPPARIDDLAAALGPLRTVEPRLAGPFQHSPCRSAPATGRLVPRVTCAEVSALTVERRRVLASVAGAIDRQAAGQAPAALHALGVKDLALRGDERAIATAVRHLEQARDGAPRNPDVWSDLAAAYLVRAEVRDEPYDLALALAAAERATGSTARPLPAACFNRALALEKLGLVPAARAAWSEYLDLDPRSPWALEARAHRAALRGEIGDLEYFRQSLTSAAERGDRGAVAALVARRPAAAHEVVELGLLGGWAAARRAGDTPGAARLLGAARVIAGAVKDARGEALGLDAVARIEAAERAAGSHARDVLLRGHLAFAAGWDLYRQRRDLGRAWSELAAAARDLAQAGSSMAYQARYYLACCSFVRQQFLAASSEVARLEADEGTGRRALRAQTLMLDGLVQTQLGMPLLGITRYERAIALFDDLGEADNAAWAHALLAESLARLGSRRLAWNHCVRALHAASALDEPRRRFLLFSIGGDLAMANDQPEVAIYFRDEVVRAVVHSDPMMLADALVWQALAAGRLGRGDAWHGLEQAKAATARLGDPAERDRNLSHIALVEGTLLLDTDPRLAADHLTRALAVYEPHRQAILAMTAHHLRARARRRLGDLTGAAADFGETIVLAAGVGMGEGDEAVKQAFRHESSIVFAEAIALQVDLGRSDLAFALAESERAGSLPRGPVISSPAGELSVQTDRGEPDASMLASLCNHLPRGTALVRYARSGERLFVWLCQRSGSKFIELRAQEIQPRLNALRAALDGSQWRAPAGALFEQLVRPWMGLLDGGVGTLVLIPDASMQGVPYAALEDARDGRMLVEDFRILLLPSATLYLRSLDRSQPPVPSAAGRMLVIGNPDFPRTLFPDLPALPAAASEARAVAGLYRSPVVLLGAAATRRQVLAAAAQATRIHFAGHAVIDLHDPLGSMLLLSPADGDPGLLRAGEIHSLRLAHVDLVVLGACGTGAATGESDEGSSSLAQAFLGAGARAVLATLWAVEDADARRLFTSFHRRVESGLAPADALRQTQLEELHGGTRSRSPAAWAALELIGAGNL